MRQRLALPLAALLVALLAATGALSVTQASAAEASASAQAQAQAQATGRQCMPRPARKSLIVRGKVTCKAVKRFLPAARELAMHTQEHGYERFTIRGFMCELRPDYKRFACRDIDGQPRRSFVWADHTG